MLDKTWKLLATYFKPAEVNMKKELVDKYWH
jgi:vacuolar-type H+-ATPase subunit B/Vma2